ncbi:hypothetical protein ABIE64_002668 [Thalassospira sp. MBR-102]|jgi:hypothetical protein
MKVLLVVLAYLHSGGVGGGISMDVETKELPNMETCVAAGEALRQMSAKGIQYSCVPISEK